VETWVITRLSAGNGGHHRQRTESSPVYQLLAFCFSGELDLPGEVGFATHLGLPRHGGAERTQRGLWAELDDPSRGFCGNAPRHFQPWTHHRWWKYASISWVPGLADRLGGDVIPTASPDIPPAVVAKAQP